MLLAPPDRLNDDDWQATRELESEEEWNSAPLSLFKRPPSMTHIMVGHRGARGRGQEGEDQTPADTHGGHEEHAWTEEGETKVSDVN